MKSFCLSQDSIGHTSQEVFDQVLGPDQSLELRGLTEQLAVNDPLPVNDPLHGPLIHLVLRGQLHDGALGSFVPDYFKKLVHPHGVWSATPWSVLDSSHFGKMFFGCPDHLPGDLEVLASCHTSMVLFSA